MYICLARTDRYQHELDVDTDDTDDSPLFGFSSCSHRYRKSQTRTRLAEESHDAQDSSGTGSDGSVGNPKSEKSKATNSSSASVSALAKEKVDNTGEPVSPKSKPSTTSASSSISSTEKPKSANLVSQLSTPESSQTESEEISPQIHRRRRAHRDALPRFSISASSVEAIAAEMKFAAESAEKTALKLSGDVTDLSFSGLSPLHQSTPTSYRKDSSSRNFVKSASAFGLSLQIPEVDAATALVSTPQSVQSPGGSSTASSRDTSPCRELSPLINSLKPPIILRRGPQGLGFTLRAIRVYFGDSNVYTVQHLVKEVTEGSPAFEAGLRAGDLITQVL
jgi:microtubule-associated serine/threonine kinase